MPIIGQNALLNQYAPMYCINSPVEGQILIYDSITKTWKNQSVNLDLTDTPDNEIIELKLYTNVGDNATITYVIPWEAQNKQSLEITLNGVRQQEDAFNIAIVNPGMTEVTFAESPLAIDQIEIIGFVTTNPDTLKAYQVTADGAALSYRVPWLIPTPSSVFVYFDGIKQQVGTYTTTKESSSTIVTFFTPPAAGVVIEFSGVEGNISYSQLETVVDGQNLTTQGQGLFTFTARTDQEQVLYFKTIEGRDGVVTRDIGNTIVIQLDNAFVENVGGYVGTNASYTMTDKDAIIGIKSTATQVNINLLNATTLPPGKQLVIKDESGFAVANNITITPFSGQRIDGMTSDIIDSNYGKVTLYTDGVNWFKI